MIWRVPTYSNGTGDSISVQKNHSTLQQSAAGETATAAALPTTFHPTVLTVTFDPARSRLYLFLQWNSTVASSQANSEKGTARIDQDHGTRGWCWTVGNQGSFPVSYAVSRTGRLTRRWLRRKFPVVSKLSLSLLFLLRLHLFIVLCSRKGGNRVHA